MQLRHASTGSTAARCAALGAALSAFLLTFGCGDKAGSNAANAAAGGPNSAAGAGSAAASAAATGNAAAGNVIAIDGIVTARRASAGATARTLALSDAIFGDDTVETAAEASVTIALLHNNARWALGPSQSRRVDTSLAWRAPRTSEEAVLARAPVDLSTAAAGRHSEQEAASTTESQQRPMDQAAQTDPGFGVGHGAPGRALPALAPSSDADERHDDAERKAAPPAPRVAQRKTSKPRPAKTSAPTSAPAKQASSPQPPSNPKRASGRTDEILELLDRPRRPGAGSPSAATPPTARAGSGASSLSGRGQAGATGIVGRESAQVSISIDVHLKVISGQLSTGQERALMVMARTRMRQCAERTARVSAKVAGKLVVRVAIDAQGITTKSELVSETVGDATMRACALAGLRAIRVPAGSGDAVVEMVVMVRTKASAD